MSSTHLHTCTLCEATCGVVVTVDGDQVVSVRGDKDDPMSGGSTTASTRRSASDRDDGRVL